MVSSMVSSILMGLNFRSAPDPRVDLIIKDSIQCHYTEALSKWSYNLEQK